MVVVQNLCCRMKGSYGTGTLFLCLWWLATRFRVCPSDRAAGYPCFRHLLRHICVVSTSLWAVYVIVPHRSACQHPQSQPVVYTATMLSGKEGNCCKNEINFILGWRTITLLKPPSSAPDEYIFFEIAMSVFWVLRVRL